MTFGETGTGNASNSEIANAKDVTPFTCNETGTISKLTLRCWASPAIHVKGIIYDSSGNKLAESAEATTATSEGWLDLTFASPPSCTNGVTYWLGFITDGAMSFREQQSSPLLIYYNEDTYSDGASNPFGSYSTYTGGHICVYATVTPSGGGAVGGPLVQVM